MPPAACGLTLSGFLPPYREHREISGSWTHSGGCHCLSQGLAHLLGTPCYTLGRWPWTEDTVGARQGSLDNVCITTPWAGIMATQKPGGRGAGQCCEHGGCQPLSMSAVVPDIQGLCILIKILWTAGISSLRRELLCSQRPKMGTIFLVSSSLAPLPSGPEPCLIWNVQA